MSQCPACPLRDSATACLGATEPMFAYFCTRAAEGDPAWLRMIADRSEAGYTPSPPVADAAPAPAPSLPLTGDLVAAATARLGLDRLAKYVAGQLGADCGCAGRQEKLNRLDARLRRWLGMG